MKDPLEDTKIVHVEDEIIKSTQKSKWIIGLIFLSGFFLTCIPLSFFYGRMIEFQKNVDLISETSVLKFKANELEEEIMHLRNYSVLIDALATSGEASRSLFRNMYLGTDTIFDTLNRIIVIDSTKEEK